MRRGIGYTHGSLATVALLVVLLGTIGLAGLSVAPRSSAGTFQLAAPSHEIQAAALPQPAVGPVSALVTITNAPGAYVLLPYAVNWSIVVTNGSVTKGSTWMSVAVADITGSGVCVQAQTCPIVSNQSVTSLVQTGTTSYSFSLTTANLTVNGPLPQDQFLISVWVTINNTVSNATFGAGIERFIVPSTPNGGFVAPLSGASLSTGNVTIGINYTGAYVSGAQVTVYQGTSASGSLVYSGGVFAPGSGEHVVIAASPWYVSVAGSYFAVLTLTSPYGTYSFTTSWTVVAAGQTIYQNSSSYQNQTLIPGLSPAVGGTVLLVVGLIVGIVVAMALGRMVWGGAKATPAQPWQAKPTTNECSVCHQSFATEAELKEHAKTAHGM